MNCCFGYFRNCALALGFSFLACVSFSPEASAQSDDCHEDQAFYIGVGEGSSIAGAAAKKDAEGKALFVCDKDIRQQANSDYEVFVEYCLEHGFTEIEDLTFDAGPHCEVRISEQRQSPVRAVGQPALPYWHAISGGVGSASARCCKP